MNAPYSRRFYAGCILLLAVVPLGCRRGASDAAAAEAAVAVVGPEYSAGKGLYVPDETRRSIGLQFVDVAEEKVTRTIELPLRVFELRATEARAVGFVERESAGAFPPGGSVRVRAGGEEFAGRVLVRRDEPERHTPGLEVIIALPRSPALAQGGAASAVAALDATQPAVTVPQSSVIRGTEGDFVYTLSGEHFVRTPVKTGAAANGRVEVLDGLYSGDRVVSEAAMSLWLAELAAVKGGHACCVLPPKGR